MSYKIEIVDSHLRQLGEGPHWDEKGQKLYYVDILKPSICCYDPQKKTVSEAVVGKDKKPVSIIIPVENEINKFLISCGNDISVIEWNGISESVIDVDILNSTADEHPAVRINDGKCSPSGVLLAGSMEANISLFGGTPPIGLGSLYALVNKKIKKIFNDVKISNGLAWTTDEKTLYYNDSLLFRVDSFDYDATNIELSNRKTIFDFKANKIPGFPDGMTIDKDENLWVAVYKGNRVIKIDPRTGLLLETIKFPDASQITSVAFGGKHLNELYVTSAAQDDESTYGGCTFKVTGLTTQGYPGVPVKIYL